MRTALQTFGLVLTLALLAIAPVAAQGTSDNYVVDIPTGTDPTGVKLDEGGDIPWGTKLGIRITGFPFPVPAFDPRVIWREQWLCRNGGPSEVTGFVVSCQNSTFLDFHIADCCIPGDHWQLKGKAWDANPNTGVTTSPGPMNVYSVPGRIYNYGGTPQRPRLLNAYVECSYLTGTNWFLADSFVAFSSDGACTVAADPTVRRIDRAP